MRCVKCGSDGSVKAGFRRTKTGPVQRYRCSSCGAHFIGGKDRLGRFPMNVVLHSMELYNLGHSPKDIKRALSKEYLPDPSVRTIQTWANDHSDLLPFLKLRRRYDLDPERIIVTKVFNHQQVIPFSYHDLKLNISARTLPGLKRYVNWVMRSLPDRMFLEGSRASTTKMATDLVPRSVDDPSTGRCSLALTRMSNRSSAHTSVEEFFLINDDITVCTELPVFLNPSEIPELELQSPLTGHIDLVQVRFDKVWILDYKPNLNRPEEYSSQLYLYKEALHRRTAIPKGSIMIGAFNEHNMYVYE